MDSYIVGWLGVCFVRMYSLLYDFAIHPTENFDVIRRVMFKNDSVTEKIVKNLACRTGPTSLKCKTMSWGNVIRILLRQTLKLTFHCIWHWEIIDKIFLLRKRMV